MSRGKMAMMLMTALALPGPAGALGLGEIRVESGLNEPLAAEIDIVGATDEDLSGITAAIANRDTFARYGVERPAFLSSADIKIVRNAAGRSFLAVRSKDSFTEPMVEMLVDLRWHGGEMIRQYTLLLDPPGLAQAVRPDSPPVAAPLTSTLLGAAAAEPVAARASALAPAPAAAAASSGSALASTSNAPRIIKVGARATLRGLARRLGARGDADLTRTMIALFHANPGAFEGNINRLRRGASLTVPSTASIAAISIPEARREFRSQMQSWRGAASLAASAKAVALRRAPALSPDAASSHEAPAASATAREVPQSAPAAAAAAAAAASATEETSGESAAALDRRVRTLEKSLSALQDLLDREHDKLTRVQATVLHDQKAAETAAEAPKSRPLQIWPIAAASALLFAALAAFRWGRRRPAESARPAALGASLNPAFAHADSLGLVERPSAPAQAGGVAGAISAQPSATAVSPAAAAPPNGAPPTAPLPAAASSSVPASSTAPASPPAAVSPEDARIEAKLAALGLLEGVDVASLEASYLLESSDEPEQEADAADAAETARLESAGGAADGVDGTDGEDPNGRTMPVAAARPAASEATVETTRLDYNLTDLDATAHHVQMPSRLHENVGFKERRTSLVDALKIAIEREPNRGDLRMKLLETYYAAAATNRQGFLDLVRKIAGERTESSGEDWDKIVRMGRQIASDSELFAAEAPAEDDEDLANCA